jgi:23S rRNA pseudouridine955/2504/2580 synthase
MPAGELIGESARIDQSKLHRIRVLFEDDDLLAVAKPPGIAVHGGAGEERATVIDLVRAAYDKEVAVDLVHRLDRGTSGILVLAKSKEAARRLAAEWGRSSKKYLALALGRWAGPSEIATPIDDREGLRRTARTKVNKVRELASIEPASTLLVIELDTGRTHQIRKHLAELGHPILLDDQHGDFPANRAFLRALKTAGARAPRKALMLHAGRVRVLHPRTRKPLEFSAPPPTEWREIVRIAAGPGAEVDALLQVP